MDSRLRGNDTTRAFFFELPDRLPEVKNQRYWISFFPLTSQVGHMFHWNDTKRYKYKEKDR